MRSLAPRLARFGLTLSFLTLVVSLIACGDALGAGYGGGSISGALRLSTLVVVAGYLLIRTGLILAKARAQGYSAIRAFIAAVLLIPSLLLFAVAVLVVFSMLGVRS